MFNVKVAKRARSIEYAIRDVIIYAKALAKAGRKIYYLNIGDPVAFDFDTPEHVKQALFEAVRSGDNAYSASEGLPELRLAISEKEKRLNGVDVSADEIIVTSGISEGIQMVMAALVEAGDEVLLPGPTYPPYISYARFFGGFPVTYRTVEDNGWQPDIEDLRRKISDKTRAIVVINPNNPCGALYEEKTLKQILDVAAEHGVPVISDEIYDQLVFEKRFVSVASIAKDVPVIGLNGFSKAYLMTGWRLGYIYFHSPRGELQELKECIEKEARIRICASTPVQKAGIAALKGPQDHIREMVSKLRARRDYVWKRLNEIEGISCTKPEAAFYVFPKIHGIGSRWKTDFDFVLELLRETGVLFVHGSGFCPVYGAGHVRGVFLPPIETLEKALNLVERFMEKNG
ncbi:MAG: aminotransferase class I/II-fold pyridoxal phosphate-dependent enzyme [Candidatus Bathyarchaeota archaeon]|nr:aminotransferase class I/II-fold pyridoxal phosphate-dependent enzyme [Candidatus Bathyarchaeota archaeon]MDW8039806.1 aminotransferase class I/II-fold pyridoxal phosphate-dependent enzyme [Nitrososphaerota archaeon]